ncbi:RNA polymerase II elongation factor ELL-like [Liolophura sinensis]|uniref:RNA polymerase II elongation factor ELL-like n=1 Tax=Liolophura sinensis TaxID=3198878 RepID=UPI0031590A96
MAALVEGQNYGLSSRNAASGSKSVIQLKLTDSSLKAFEEFGKIKDGTSRRPTIQFQGSQGHIKIPAKKSSDDPEGMRSFHFTLSAFQGDLNGSLECVQQNNSRFGRATMDLLGSMSHKVVVHATDDVYKTTRQRMTQAEEESKKVCTKVIKISGQKISHRSKKVIRDGSLHVPTHGSKSASSGQHSSVGHKYSHSSGSHFSAINRSVKPLSSNQNISNSTSNHASRPLVNSHSSNQGLPSSMSSSSNSHSSVPPSSGNAGTLMGSSMPRSHNHSSSPLGQRPAQSPSPVMNYPYRDRIIHLLAVRPYKKPELLLRLSKDGVKEKDKKSLSTILQQVATFSAKDNRFTLSRHAFSEVKVDWPFYSEADRMLVKRKVADVRNASVSPASSPANSNPESPSNSQKRPSENYSNPQPSKKQRISHYVRKENKDIYRSHQPEKQSPTSTTSPESSLSIKSRAEECNVVAHSTSETPEYQIKYKRISDKDQRQKYKQDFNREYEEYMVLHSNIDKVTKTFASLEEKMKRTEQGTDEHENLKNMILKEYRSRKSDQKYVEQKKRFDYLHKKLGHIKQLIVEYDQAQLAA